MGSSPLTQSLGSFSSAGFSVSEVAPMVPSSWAAWLLSDANSLMGTPYAVPPTLIVEVPAPRARQAEETFRASLAADGVEQRRAPLENRLTQGPRLDAPPGRQGFRLPRPAWPEA